jgi:hypothetical protein
MNREPVTVWSDPEAVTKRNTFGGRDLTRREQKSRHLTITSRKKTQETSDKLF